MKKIGRLCVITDTAVQSKYSHFEIVKLAIKGGADMIQFRDKMMSTSELIDTAIKLKKLCAKHNATFVVNDRVDVAMISDADGVHLGLEDISIKDARKLLGKSKIVGGTAHSLKEVVEAQKNGADYIGFGHIYPTGSKIKKDKPKGTTYLKKVVNEIKTPIIAIGGISSENIQDVMNTGVYGAAVIGSVVKSKKPVDEVKKLRKIIHG